MAQKTISAAQSEDQSKSSTSVPAPQTVGTAPEVPHEVAKQYQLHKEALHQPSTSDKASADATSHIPSETADTLATPETDAAVDDIVSKESDALLGIQDEAAATRPAVPRSFGNKLKAFFTSWWRNKTARYTTLAILTVGVIITALVPTTRYGMLNLVGVRSSASVVVLDATTQLPLKNVTVSLNDRTVQTNRDGIARLRDLKLGNYQLQIKRIAFAPYSQRLTIGWGSNPLGNVKLQAVGTQYQIEVKDYLSGKPIAGAEAKSEAVNALADKAGKIILTVEDTDITTLDITLNAPGYRSEAVKLDASTATVTPVALVPAQKAVYVSKAGGKYDVYSSYIDGKDKKLLLAGSGLESNNIALVVSPDNKQAALVSTRDNLRDRDQYLLYALTFINIDEGTSVTVDHAQQIQLVDWVGERLIYRSTIAGVSGSNPQRNRLIAYNFTANARAQLAAANQFNALLSANGYIYYAASSTDPGATLGLFRVKPDNSGRERLIDQEIWTGLRTNLTTLSLQTPTGWLSLDLSSRKTQNIGPPSDFANLLFTTRGDRTVWTDVRDGKGVLLFKDDRTGKTTELATHQGLTNPVRWLNDTTILYRVVTSSEAADYALSVDGGTARKVNDVTATGSYTQAY